MRPVITYSFTCNRHTLHHLPGCARLETDRRTHRRHSCPRDRSTDTVCSCTRWSDLPLWTVYRCTKADTFHTTIERCSDRFHFGFFPLQQISHRFLISTGNVIIQTMYLSYFYFCICIFLEKHKQLEYKMNQAYEPGLLQCSCLFDICTDRVWQ